MSTIEPSAGPVPRRTTKNARRAGYVAAALVNAGLLVVINSWPGWQQMGFLTPDAGQVIGLVNMSLIFGLIINACYLIADPEWLRGLGDAVSAAFAVAILVRLLLTFPFSLPNEGVELGLRIGLFIGAIGAGIGVIVGVVRFAKGILAPR